MRALLSCLLSFTGKLIWKMSPIEFSEILGVFVKTLTANDKYLVLDCEKLPLPIPTQLSEKRKTFSEYFIAFLESTSNFKDFERKYDRHSQSISELQTVKNLVRTLSKKPRLRTRFDTQDVKASQILAKPP